MLNPRQRQHGVTLVEISITLAIVAILLSLGAPSFSQWLQNTQIRTAAQGIQNGLQLARAEAVRRNTTVGFSFTNTLDGSCALASEGPDWVISMGVPANDLPGACGSTPSDTVAPRIIQKRPGAETGANVVIAADQPSIVFNGLGRVSPVPLGNVAINVTNPSGGSCVAAGGTMRCLRVQVSPVGQVRMCDPVKTSPDPTAC
ncbi:prepilin-type N-terminal cleavage/methylation domain-containing protein [Herbaspirillum sp. HC18]|nr:prepilin-type N-terminal cleavage/methylation domain-containing protein [Herbaspirillum sp. HC18]